MEIGNTHVDIRSIDAVIWIWIEYCWNHNVLLFVYK